MKYNIELISSINGESAKINGIDVCEYDLTFKRGLIKAIVDSIIYTTADTFISDLCFIYGTKKILDDKSTKRILEVEL